MKDQWYVATLLVQCRVEGHDNSLKTVDEQIRVLRAPDSELAFAKALELGKGEEHSYDNAYGERVVWEFIGLADLRYLDSNRIEDGTEIASRFLRKKSPADLVRSKDDLTVFVSERSRYKARTRSA